ncbi:Retrovirus-related Pol polyprotein from transposon TNT 1-94 [Apostasia shenzhenica]|uniref:Retrovirus-related Pol polyprotein from transposon TNT 1-94 n=1 Tax=Apostasia shenzhenica TaxID=1088818 RepID=A0A2H9ZU38_9ASPA|nr:Retrovirus-related Pol polyprotein from transposon TNT 1-94 [Apostasia shenzhenica]
MHGPTRHHFGVAKRILRYITGTTDYGLWFSNITNFKLFGFSDSDWAGSLDDRRSTSGNFFSLGSSAISWCSKKQATTTLLSTEAEYVVITLAVCQVVWLRRLLEELHQMQEDATNVFCDNKATIALTKNPIFHGRTKHVDIKHHFIRELTTESIVDLKFCNTNEQVADILTKALPYKKFVYFRTSMGVCNFESRGMLEIF